MLITTKPDTVAKAAPEVTRKNPCVRNCCLNEQDICLGCGRTLVEITGWTRLTDAEREHVLMAAERRKKENNSGLFSDFL